MAVRPFDWRDLAVLHRYRHQSVFLDSALLLTYGPIIVPGALLSYLAPATGIFTCISSESISSVSSEGEAETQSLVGQFIHANGSPFAHLTFLTPDTALESCALPALLDYLAIISGERGALRILAEVDEQSMAFEALRQAGFAIYSRQRIWQFTGPSTDGVRPVNWRIATGQDLIGIRSLYNNLVPGMVQQVEPFAMQPPKGWVCLQGDTVQAYVEIKYGHRGIWIQPFVHPDADDMVDRFLDLLQNLPYRYSRPIYLCVRSYQSWLEHSFEDLGALSGSRQAVMVRHLAVQQKAARMFALPSLESGCSEVSASVVHLESKS